MSIPLECLKCQCGAPECTQTQRWECAAAGYSGVRTCFDPLCQGIGPCGSQTVAQYRAATAAYSSDYRAGLALPDDQKGAGAMCGCNKGNAGGGGMSATSNAGGAGSMGLVPLASQGQCGCGNASGVALRVSSSWLWLLLLVGVAVWKVADDR